MKRPLESPGLYAIPLNGRLVYMTADQLIRANRESIRLGFNRNLSIPRAKVLRKKLLYPITNAWHHVGFNGGDHNTANVRLFFYFAVRRDGLGGRMVCLDITPDLWQEILSNPTACLR
ncbi:MAG: hypothetical protein ACYC0X_12215 [Pirellulaceae bacterium]